MEYVKVTNFKDAIIDSWEVLQNRGKKRLRNNQSKIEECLEIGLCLDIRYDEHFSDYYAPKCVMFEDIEGLVEYDLEFTYGINDGKFNYTYHQLFAPYLNKCIDELVNNPQSRRAVLPIAGEMSYKDEYPPCLQLMMVELSDRNEVNITVVFRSNDAVKAFPSNLFAVKRLQDYIVTELTDRSENDDKYWMGNIVYIANNFHAYGHDYKMLNGYLNRMYNAEDEKLFWTADEYLEAITKYVEGNRINV